MGKWRDGWIRFQMMLVRWAREKADLTHPPNPLPPPLTERKGGAAVRRLSLSQATNRLWNGNDG